MLDLDSICVYAIGHAHGIHPTGFVPGVKAGIDDPSADAGFYLLGIGMAAVRNKDEEIHRLFLAVP